MKVNQIGLDITVVGVLAEIFLRLSLGVNDGESNVGLCAGGLIGDGDDCCLITFSNCFISSSVPISTIVGGGLNMLILNVIGCKLNANK